MIKMETLFIGYPSCSTCKKAYKALQDLGIEATYRNIKEENPTKEEIQSWIDLLASNGMLIKRPIVIQKDRIIVGNKVSEYETLKNRPVK